MAAKKKPMKGTVGKNTGGKTRAAIKAAQSKGCTLKQIAKGSNRSVDTISAINSGDIKNPPSNVAASIVKACKNAKPKKK